MEELRNDKVFEPEITRDFISVNYTGKRVVVLTGPHECGKTVALLVLYRYLQHKKNGTKVDIDAHFRNDKEDYKKTVKRFKKIVEAKDYQPNSTALLDFLCVNVYRRGRLYCQILESPGERLFPSSNPNSMKFPSYLSKAYNDGNLSITYAIFYNEDIAQSNKRHLQNYLENLEELIPKVRPGKDSILLVYNKIDKYKTVNSPNDKTEAKRLIQNGPLADLYAKVKDSNIRWDFMTFSSGEFTQSEISDEIQWTAPDIKYPEKFWKKIQGGFGQKISW